MENGPAQPNKGLLAGVIAMLLAGGVRVMDDCARMGVRAAGHADDIAGAGVRLGGHSADEVAGAGARLGGRHADDMVGRGAHFGPGVDPALAGRWLDDVPYASSTEPNQLLEAALEGGADVAFQVLDVAVSGADEGPYEDDVEDEWRQSADDESPLVRRDVALVVACPARIDLGTDAARWRRVVEEGFGAACAPYLLFARAVPGAPSTLMSGAGERDVRQLAAECWDAGTTCVIVACDDECGAPVRAARTGVPGPDVTLERYTTELVQALMALEPKPRTLAVVRGDRAPQLQMIVR